MQAIQVTPCGAFPEQIIQCMNLCFRFFESLKDFFSDDLIHLLWIQCNIQINLVVGENRNCVLIGKNAVLIGI